MGSIKNKIGMLLLLLCLGAIMVAIWYGLFGLSKEEKEIDGTLVYHNLLIEQMVES